MTDGLYNYIVCMRDKLDSSFLSALAIVETSALFFRLILFLACSVSMVYLFYIDTINSVREFSKYFIIMLIVFLIFHIILSYCSKSFIRTYVLSKSLVLATIIRKDSTYKNILSKDEKEKFIASCCDVMGLELEPFKKHFNFVL